MAHLNPSLGSKLPSQRRNPLRKQESREKMPMWLSNHGDPTSEWLVNGMLRHGLSVVLLLISH